MASFAKVSTILPDKPKSSSGMFRFVLALWYLQGFAWKARCPGLKGRLESHLGRHDLKGLDALFVHVRNNRDTDHLMTTMSNVSMSASASKMSQATERAKCASSAQNVECGLYYSEKDTNAVEEV